jgi:hypothetical protein
MRQSHPGGNHENGLVARPNALAVPVVSRIADEIA